jgi:protein SCO1/2
MKWFRIKLIFVSFFFLNLFSCQRSTSSFFSDELPYYQDASFTPFWHSKIKDSLNRFHKIPPFRLVNQLGDTISENTFKEKVYVADFFFTTCPGICPMMTSNMSLIQEAFKDESRVLLLSHSVTPEYDSVPVLKEYAKEKGVLDNKWHLVTGDRKVIYDLGRKSYFIEESLGEISIESDFLHTENFVLIDQNRHIRGIYNGLRKNDINQLIKDIRTLIHK